MKVKLGEDRRGPEKEGGQAGEGAQSSSAVGSKLPSDRSWRIQKMPHERKTRSEKGTHRRSIPDAELNTVTLAGTDQRAIGCEGLLVPGQELRGGHLMRACLGRIVEGKLVLKAPRKDRKRQSQKKEGPARNVEPICKPLTHFDFIVLNCAGRGNPRSKGPTFRHQKGNTFL